MDKKIIFKNIILSIILGGLLGTITEFALILDINWLIPITQSFLFWGIIMCISTFVSKNYVFALMNPILIMTMMNTAYYGIRYIKSGYTNIASYEMFTLVGIAGALYIGTFIYLLKKRFIKHNSHISVQIYAFLFMTIGLIIFAKYDIFNNIVTNGLYSISFGIMIGFILGISLSKIIKYIKYKKQSI